MNKSIAAKVMSDLLKLWPKLSEEECEKKLDEVLHEEEKLCPLRRSLKGGREKMGGRSGCP